MNKLFFLSILFFATACSNVEIGDSNDIEPEAIAQQIDINYKEGQELTAQFRCRVSGVNGTTLVLLKPASVSLNGDILKVDSSSGTGAFYKQSLPATPGKHSFAYTDKNGKTLTNSFEFTGFALNKPFPQTVSKANDLQLQFSGIAPNAEVHYYINDTSFGNSIDEKINLSNGALTIKAAQLSKLKPGPITVEFSHQKKSPLQNGTREGGEINYNYELKKIKAKLQ